jgi:hypothetical protein
MSDTDIISVPENPYGVVDVRRERPYLSTDEERERWMRFNRVYQLILESRIDELNGRYNQIYFIRQCKLEGLYLIGADRSITTSRAKESYFYDWLKELYEKDKIPVAAFKTWERAEMNIIKCMNAGMTEERAIAAVAVGDQALKALEEHGVLSVKQIASGELAYERGPRADEVMGENTGVTDYLERIADSKSSRGATMMVRYDLGKGRTASIGNIWTDKNEPEINGMKQVFIEVEDIDTATGEKTPYAFRLLYEKDTPPEVVKYILRAAGTERFSRVAFQ